MEPLVRNSIATGGSSCSHLQSHLLARDFSTLSNPIHLMLASSAFRFFLGSVQVHPYSSFSSLYKRVSLSLLFRCFDSKWLEHRVRKGGVPHSSSLFLGKLCRNNGRRNWYHYWCWYVMWTRLSDWIWLTYSPAVFGNQLESNIIKYASDLSPEQVAAVRQRLVSKPRRVIMKLKLGPLVLRLFFNCPRNYKRKLFWLILKVWIASF
jgi:hypothetical protein